MLGQVIPKNFVKRRGVELITLLLLFLFLAAWSFKNFQLLQSYNEPSGTDGYFYLKQILTLTQHHQFYFKDHSIAFWVPVALNFFCNNELLAYQISIVLTMSLIGFALTKICLMTLNSENHRLPKGLSLVTVTLTTLTCFSNYFLYELGYNYLKTSVALLLFLLGVLCFEYTPSKKPTNLSKKSLYTVSSIGTLLFLLSLFAHKTSLVLIGLYLIVNLKWKKLYIYLVLTFALLGWFFINFFYPSGKQYLLFILNHQFTNPTLFLNWIEWLIKENNWLATGPILTLLSLLSAYFFQDSQPKKIALFTGLLGILAWNPFFIQNIDSPSYRLAIIHWAITPPILIGLWLNILSRFDFLLAILISFIVTIAFKTGPSLHGFFKGYSKMDTTVSRLTHFIKPGEHLTCHHGMEFYVDYHTPIRCRSFISNQLEQKKWRIVWAPFQKGPWNEARILLNAESPLRLGRDYFLIPEKRWLEILTLFHLRLNWRNPMVTRPAHIYE